MLGTLTEQSEALSARMRIKQKLSGVFPSITTPFVSGEVECGRLASNIERYNALELGGYMILGGNGEYLGLTEKETFTVVETIMRCKRAGRTVIAGAGRESSKSTIDFIKSIAGFGIDIASVITPFYFSKQMRDENLIAYYQHVADGSPVPILIYNSPAYAAGVEISPYAVSVLSRHENIVGMKNSSARELSEYIAAVDADDVFYFHAGKAAVCYSALQQGAVGATLSAAIYWPEACIDLYTHVQKGEHKEAQRIADRLNCVAKAGASKYGVPGIKYAMDLRGFFGGEPRLPLLPLTRSQKDDIEQSITSFGRLKENEDFDRVR